MMAARVELREISNEEGNRLLRIVRRGGGSVVTWRRAQIVLLAAQGMSPTRISEVVFTDPDTVRELIHNFNGDGFDALYPRYRGGRPQTFTLPQRQQIKTIALSGPTDLGQPFATWSLAKLADYLVAEGVVTDISHEGLRELLHEEGVRFQALRTWKRSNDPAFEGQEEPDPRAVRARRGGRGGRDLPGRVWAAQPAAAAGREGVGAAGEAAPDPGDLHPPTRPPPPPLRLRPRPRPPLRARQEAQEPGRVPRLLPLPPLALSAHHAAPLRARQLQPAPGREGARLGAHQQRRARLHALLRLLAEPDRGTVPGAPLLLHRRHRPPRPRDPSPTDPPLHRLAQQSSRQPTPTPARPPRQHGKRCLTLH